VTRAILIYAIGLCLLICCLGASAQGVLAASEPIDESTGITLGIVCGAIGIVAWGAWQISRYTQNLEERIRDLENRDKQ
jgi:hypothetical protein